MPCAYCGDLTWSSEHTSPRPPAASTGSERAGTCSTPQCRQGATCASKRRPVFLAHALGSPLFWLWPTSLALVYVPCHRLQDPSLPTCPDLSQVAPTDTDLQVSGRLVGQGGGTGHGLVMSKANSMDLSEQEQTDIHNKSNSFLDEEPIPGPRGSNLGRRNREASYSPCDRGNLLKPPSSLVSGPPGCV